MQHKEIVKKKKILESSDGQRKPLCCNEGRSRCPSLDYKFIESNQDLEEAYRLLFDYLLNVKHNRK